MLMARGGLRKILGSYLNFKVQVIYSLSPSSHFMSQLNLCACRIQGLSKTCILEVDSFKTFRSFLQVSDIEEEILKHYR